MIKKLTLIFIAIFIIIFLLFTTYNIETKNCTKEEALNIAQTYVKANNKETFVNTITNFEVPTIEVVYIDKLVTHNAGRENVIRNKECYKVTFNYPLDIFTSPYDVYVNCSDGKCYGSTLKY